MGLESCLPPHAMWMGLLGLLTGNDGRQDGMGRGMRRGPIQYTGGTWNPYESCRLASLPIPEGPVIVQPASPFHPPVFFVETRPEAQAQRVDVMILFAIQN